jgi:hypothetical protein
MVSATMFHSEPGTVSPQRRLFQGGPPGERSSCRCPQFPVAAPPPGRTVIKHGRSTGVGISAVAWPPPWVSNISEANELMGANRGGLVLTAVLIALTVVLFDPSLVSLSQSVVYRRSPGTLFCVARHVTAPTVAPAVGFALAQAAGNVAPAVGSALARAAEALTVETLTH